MLEIVKTLSNKSKPANATWQESLQQFDPNQCQQIVQILERIAEAFFCLDNQWRFTYLNHQAEQALEQTRAELLGKTIWEIFSEETESDFCQNYRKAIQQHEAVTFEGFYSAVEKWFEVRVDPSHDGLSVFLRDISQQKQDLARLYLLEKAIEASSNGVVISDMNGPDRPIIYSNPAFEELTGYSPSEIIGRNCRFLQGVDTDQTEVDKIRACIRDGRDGRVTLKNYRKDGTPFWNELVISPVRDNSGNVTHFIGVQKDITARKQAEEALRQSEANLAEAQKVAHIGSWELDVATGEVTWSAEMFRIFGLDPQQPVPNQVDRQIHPSDRQLWIETLEKSLKAGTPYEIDVRIVQPDGQLRYVQAKGQSTLNKEGTVTKLFGTILDITDRKRTEAALWQHVQMLDLASDTIIILDLEATVLYWNQGAEQLYGWEKPEAIGENVHTLLKTVFPDSLETARTTCLTRGYWSGELLHCKRDGTLVIVSSRWTLQRDEKGQPLAILEINNDITERKQAEAERDRLTAILEATTDFVGMADVRGNVTYLNRAGRKILGIEAGEDVTADSISNYSPQEAARLILQEGIPAAMREGTWSGETALLHRDGREIPVSQVIIAHKTAGDTVEYLSTVARDISDRKRAEDALRQSEKREREKALQLQKTLQELKRTQTQLVQNEKMISLGQIVAGVAHEINNPVSFIYSNLSHANSYARDLLELVKLYQQHYPNPVPEIEAIAEEIELDFLVEDFSKLMNSMRSGAERIRQIVLSLRNFSRLDESEFKTVDIHEGLESTLSILQHRLNETTENPKIEVIKDYGDLPRVACYPGELNQVFVNILSNAIDAFEELFSENSEGLKKPTISIGTEMRGEKVSIRIADNGPGIPEKFRQRLFDPFFTTKPVGKGTGLGLSISYQIVVEKHGGQLTCISTPSLGTEFLIEIPLNQESRKG